MATVAVDAANEAADRAALLGVAPLVEDFVALVDSCQRLSDLLLHAASTTREATTAAQAVRDGTGRRSADARRGLQPDGTAATVDRTRQHLTGAGQATNEATRKIDETLAKWRGKAGPGN
jgi:hypothetical protein